MAYDTSPTETRTDTTVAPRYRRYLAGYLALTVVGTGVLLVLAKHSSNLLAAVELVGGGSLLVVASVATIPAFYKDATGLDADPRSPDWKPYVAFVVGSPLVVYLAVAYVTMANVAVVVAGVAVVVAAFEATAVYLFRRRKYVGSAAAES
ncbi:hypothetical protein [Halorussus salinus]|uniref:hypothetical protein n=1 Tax=Halorussus salinus TaxID=1364935 RepID=UPI001091CBAF|nr:hypothetical protein [Halorussus salinus]